MSAPLKKPRAVFPEEDYVQDDSEDEPMQDDFIGQIVNVEFEGFTASDNDFHGIKRLLQQSFRGLDVDISGIADTIISQNYVGSVIKQVGGEDEEDDEEEEMDEDDVDQVFGVTTIINLTSRKDEKCIAGLRTALVEKCAEFASDATSQQLRELLGNESKHIGLLISERVVNLPAQFAFPVFESLGKELEEAKAKQMPYDFAYLILICKVFKHEKKKKKNKTIEEEMWSNPEEEVIAEEALASFEYMLKGDKAVSGDWDEDDPQYTPYRRILLLEAKRFPEILGKVKQAVYQK